MNPGRRGNAGLAGALRLPVPAGIQGPRAEAASTSSARWQATSRPGAAARSWGTSVLHRSTASGQRGWNTQPGGGLVASGGSPGSTTRAGRAAASISGTAERRAWV